MRVELRVVVVLGLALALWLALVPTPAADGSGCGIPLIGTGSSESARASRPVDCEKRNQTRVTQSAWTLALAGITVGLDVSIRRRRAAGAEFVESPSHYE